MRPYILGEIYTFISPLNITVPSFVCPIMPKIPHCLSIQDHVDGCEPSTSSVAVTPEALAAKAAPTGSADGLNDGLDPFNKSKMEGENEEPIEERTKKSSSIRFRKKKAKQRGSKGGFLPLEGLC